MKKNIVVRALVSAVLLLGLLAFCIAFAADPANAPPYRAKLDIGRSAAAPAFRRGAAVYADGVKTGRAEQAAGRTGPVRGRGSRQKKVMAIPRILLRRNTSRDRIIPRDAAREGRIRI